MTSGFGRLLVPLLTGLVLLVAPMFYLSRVDQPGFHEPYWRFWLRFLNPAAIATGIPARGTWRSGGDEFDPAHLWFLFSLLVFSMVLTPAFVSLRRPRGARLLHRLAGLTERHPTSALLVAAVPVMAVEAALGPDKNTGGWERLTYVCLMVQTPAEVPPNQLSSRDRAPISPHPLPVVSSSWLQLAPTGAIRRGLNDLTVTGELAPQQRRPAVRLTLLAGSWRGLVAPRRDLGWWDRR